MLNLFYLPGSLAGAYISDKLGPNRTLALVVTLQSIVGFIMAGCYARLTTQIAAFTVVYGIFQSLGEAGPGGMSPCRFILLTCR